MKKVIIPKKEKTTYPQNADPRKYYGFSVSPHENDDKGFIVRAEHEKGNFIPIAVRSCTNGNHYLSNDSYEGKSLSSILMLMASREVFNVYEFDTHWELFDWLAGVIM